MFSQRCNQPIIFQSFESDFITAVLGSRRVGKSALVDEYIQQHPNQHWVKFNLDNMKLRTELIERSLEVMVEEACEKKIGGDEKIWVVIDEAQKLPAIFEAIKMIYDDFKNQNKIKFIITGSAFLQLHQLSAETLAGRIELFYLNDFNLEECVQLKHQLKNNAPSTLDLMFKQDFNTLEAVIKDKAPLRKKYYEGIITQVLWGGLPEMLQANNDEDKLRYLDNYLQTYLEKDIRAVTEITNLELYRKMISVIAEQTGSVRQDQKLLAALQCSRDTLKKYRGFLEATLMYKELYPFITTALKRIVKTPKAYLINNGLVSYLTGISDLSILEKTGLIGHRFENWILKELQVALQREPKNNSVYYWRTIAGIEVDYVVEIKPHIIPIEVTYSEQIQSKKLKNLRKFKEEFPQTDWCIYLYMGDFKLDHKEKICYFPAWAVN